MCNLSKEQAGHGAVAGVGSPRRHGRLNGLASPSSKAGCLVRFSRGTMFCLLFAHVFEALISKYSRIDFYVRQRDIAELRLYRCVAKAYRLKTKKKVIRYAMLS